jgi:hypothetical protein
VLSEQERNFPDRPRGARVGKRLRDFSALDEGAEVTGVEILLGGRTRLRAQLLLQIVAEQRIVGVVLPAALERRKEQLPLEQLPETPGSTLARISGSTTVGSEEARRNSLVSGGSEARTSSPKYSKISASVFTKTSSGRSGLSSWRRAVWRRSWRAVAQPLVRACTFRIASSLKGSRKVSRSRVRVSSRVKRRSSPERSPAFPSAVMALSPTSGRDLPMRTRWRVPGR